MRIRVPAPVRCRGDLQSETGRPEEGKEEQFHFAESFLAKQRSAVSREPLSLAMSPGWRVRLCEEDLAPPPAVWTPPTALSVSVGQRGAGRTWPGLSRGIRGPDVCTPQEARPGGPGSTLPLDLPNWPRHPQSCTPLACKLIILSLHRVILILGVTFPCFSHLSWCPVLLSLHSNKQSPRP